MGHKVTEESCSEKARQESRSTMGPHKEQHKGLFWQSSGLSWEHPELKGEGV